MSIRSDLRRAADAGVQVNDDHPGDHEREFRYFHGLFFIIAVNRRGNKRNPKLPIGYESEFQVSSEVGVKA